MKSRVRNFVVGLTVLGALVFLGFGIYRFGSAPATFFKPPQIKVVFESERGDGLGDGSTINYLGVEAGRVIDVRRDGTTNKIVINAFLYKDPPIPANVAGEIIFTSPLGGVSSINLQTEGPPAAEKLREGAVLKARFGGSNFIPPEFAQAATEIKEAVQEVRVTIKQFNDAKLIENLNATITETQKQITAAGEVVKSVNSLVSDPTMRANLQKSLDAIARTSEDAAALADRLKTVAYRFDQIAQKTDKAVDTAQGTLEVTSKRVDQVGLALTDQLQKLSSTLDNLTAITGAIKDGKGTAGMLINDPKLYQGLVDSAQKLDLTLSDVRRYIQQVEQEGFYLRLNK